MKLKLSLTGILLSSLLVNATELTREGWNLLGVCQDINVSEIDMTGISEIQSQTGETLYTGSWVRYSNLATLEAGYGYWVKGTQDVEFESGESTGVVIRPLNRTGWNLMAACEEISVSDIDMTNITEIQSQGGATLYTGDWAKFSNLSELLNGYGYWVEGQQGIEWTAKSGLTLPSGYDYDVINNANQIVETVLSGYTIKLYADYNETADAQAKHTGVVVRINGENTPIMQIQESYRGDAIVAALYNQNDELVGVSERTAIATEGAGTYIDITLESFAINHAPTITQLLSDISVTVGESSAFAVGADDQDGDTLNYEWFINDLSLGNNAADLTYTFDQEGNQTVKCVVTDNQDSVETTANVEVKAVPVTQETDSDQDYIPDSIEALLGLDANNDDMDGNGILDGLESGGTHGDTFFDKQWHIRSLGTYVNGSNVATIVGNDLDLLDVYRQYMGYNQGNPIIVQVVDDGVDADHEDLAANMDLTRSYRHNSGIDSVGDPSAINSTNRHGTMVAGIIAARAFNGVGVRGIAPFAKLAGSNWIEDQYVEGLEKVWLTGTGANEIAITNNSWGTYFDRETIYEDILASGTSTLRDGKGRIYVFAAGNDRDYYHGNSNISYITNNRYVVAVAALKHDNTHASYSSPGGNILISGYSGDYYQTTPTIGTTTIAGTASNTGDINTKTTWSDDAKKNYTFIMNGTSAASPTVAGSIALVLEACPDLTWRDVKHLLAKHGKQVDTTNEGWVENGAGLWYSSDYGYGLVNPKEMIAECSSDTYTNLGTLQTAEVTETVNAALPDQYALTVSGINVSQNFKVEWVELTIDATHPQPSDYSIYLTSPSGTTTHVVDWTRVDGDWMSGGYRFGVAAFMDEESSGEWTVDIVDYDINSEGLSGTVKSVKLKLYGHE